MNPFETTTKLMQHQADAVHKVSPIKVSGLFMDMGTGKSRTVIELVKIKAAKIDKVVWFVPVSLKLSVKQEILKHTDCADIHVFDAKTNSHNMPSCRWYIVGIESMSSSNRVVAAVNNLITDKTVVILDESSYIKGHNSKRTVRITYICAKAKYRVILTGTPLSQGVVDLYAQMRFLSPKILGYNSFYGFAQNHLEYSETRPGLIIRTHNTAWLAAKIAPYVYQVRKEDCIDLPPKNYTTKYFYKNAEQERAYEEIKETFLSKIDPNEWNSYILFQLFGALQQIVSGFYNDTQNQKFYEFENGRAALLGEIITRIPNDDQCIIWAKYHYDITQIQKELKKHGRTYVLYTGKQNEKTRETNKEQFKSGKAQFFLATPSTGGHGLTLNEASTVIFYNNGFKYAERVQAEDRCHRIGQTKSVNYIDIVCLDSIDERISTALAQKRDVLHDFQADINKVKSLRSKSAIKSILARV